MTTIIKALGKKLTDKGVELSFSNGHPYNRLATKIVVDYLDDDYFDNEPIYKETIKYLTDKLLHEIKFYRNEVKPVIVTMIESIKTQLEDHINDNPIKDFSIQDVIVFDTLLSGALKEELDNLPDVVEFTKSVMMPELSSDQVLEIRDKLTTDPELKEFIQHLEIEDIIGVYEKYLSVIGMQNVYYSIQQETVVDIWKLTLAYLLLKYFKDNIPSGNLGVNASNYERQLNIAIGKIGKRLVALVNRYKDMSRLEMVVVYTDRANKTIYVNPALYKGWIEKDSNNVEAILGLLVTDRAPNAVSIGYLDQNKDTLEENLKKYIAVSSRRKLMDIRTLYKTTLLYASREMLRELTDVEADMVKEDPSYLTVLSQKIESYIETTTLESLAAFDETVKKDVYRIVNDIRFHFTNAGVFFRYIDSIVADNPGIDIKEAVSLATVKLLTEAMLRHVVIRKR